MASQQPDSIPRSEAFKPISFMFMDTSPSNPYLWYIQSLSLFLLLNLLSLIKARQNVQQFLKYIR